MEPYTLVLLSIVYANIWYGETVMMPPALLHGFTLEGCQEEASRWRATSAPYDPDDESVAGFEQRSAHCVKRTSENISDEELPPTMSDGIPVLAR